MEKISRCLFPQIKEGQVYADWTGSALPPISLIDAHSEFLKTIILGNPHSHHSPSVAAMQEVMETRRAILEYFHAFPEEYEVIFTSGATAAIRILEHYKFEGGELLLTKDNHNSVGGLRETAKRNGGSFRYAPILKDLSIDASTLEEMLTRPRAMGQRLFAYPAKSNYSGTVHDLNWIAKAKANGWDVLLDAAAYAANERLDLSQIKPDFVPISFYKLFGFPTGLGCLIIRKEAYSRLRKKWFAGGSVLFASAIEDFYASEWGYAGFEDGSISFGQIPAIKAGLKFVQSLGDIKTHAIGLATDLYDRMVSMSEGENSIIIHSARGNDTVTFSVRRAGHILAGNIFERMANEQGVFVRAGLFCNPGVNEVVFGYGNDLYEAMYEDVLTPSEAVTKRIAQLSKDAPNGAIRASFGYANTLADTKRFAEVAKTILQNL